MADIVDAHHHFLDPERIDYPFLRFLPQLARRLTADDLAPLVRAAGVAQTVAVQASDCEDETQFLLDEAARARSRRDPRARSTASRCTRGAWSASAT